MIISTVLTPLLIEEKDNQRYIDDAVKKSETPPAPSKWKLITYNAQSIQSIGGNDVAVSTIETIKSFVEEPLEVSHPYHVNISITPYNDHNGRAALSAKIISLASDLGQKK